MKLGGAIIAVLLLLIGQAYGAPTYSGMDGYVAVPRVDTAKSGRFAISMKYTALQPGLFTPAINIVVLKGLEFGGAWDIGSYPMNPILAGVKYQFVPQAAVGANFEIPVTQNQDFDLQIYLAWEEKLKAAGIVDSSATFAIGYHIINGGQNIDFFVGFQRNLFIPQLYVIADFSNFPYRMYGIIPHQETGRGILNLGLRIILTKWFSFDLVGLDLFDDNRNLMIGANISPTLW